MRWCNGFFTCWSCSSVISLYLGGFNSCLTGRNTFSRSSPVSLVRMSCTAGSVNLGWGLSEGAGWKQTMVSYMLELITCKITSSNNVSHLVRIYQMRNTKRVFLKPFLKYVHSFEAWFISWLRQSIRGLSKTFVEARSPWSKVGAIV